MNKEIYKTIIKLLIYTHIKRKGISTNTKINKEINKDFLKKFYTNKKPNDLNLNFNQPLHRSIKQPLLRII